MHISDTGVLDPTAYALNADAGAGPANWWRGTAKLAPAALLYAVLAFLSAVALHVAGAGVTWTPMG